MSNESRGGERLGPYAVLFDTGVYITAFGPALPFIARDLGVSPSVVGLLLTALFAGSIAASALVAWAGHRRDQRRAGLAGLFLIAVGLAGIGLSPTWAGALGSAIVLGAGDGLAVASAHILIAKLGGDLPRAMTRLNIAFGVGAIAGPLWAGALLAGGGGRAALYCGMLAVPALAAAALSASGRRSVAGQANALPTGSAAPVAWVMGIVLLIYVGAEVGLGEWVSSYMGAAFGTGVLAGAVVTAGYWAALTAGRVTGNALLGRGHSPRWQLTLAISGALAGSLLLTLASGALAIGAVGALVSGLCFGPIWPCALGIASQDASPRVPAILVTVGNAGGLILPWLQGAVLNSAGPRDGMALTTLFCALMLAGAGIAIAPALRQKVGAAPTRAG